MSDYDFEQFKQDFLGGVSNAADAVAGAARDTGDSVGRYKNFVDSGSEVAKLNNTTHGGNISVSDGTSIWITRTGARLGRLTPGDIVHCTWDPSENDAQASMELIVHRAIYKALAGNAAAGVEFKQAAIIHAHCLYTNYQSYINGHIEPVDSEGKALIGRAKVVACEQTVASQEVADKLACLVQTGEQTIVVREHGPFVVADSLDQALRRISALEYSAHMLTLLSGSS